MLRIEVPPIESRAHIVTFDVSVSADSGAAKKRGDGGRSSVFGGWTSVSASKPRDESGGFSNSRIPPVLGSSSDSSFALSNQQVVFMFMQGT